MENNGIKKYLIVYIFPVFSLHGEYVFLCALGLVLESPFLEHASKGPNHTRDRVESNQRGEMEKRLLSSCCMARESSPNGFNEAFRMICNINLL